MYNLLVKKTVQLLAPSLDCIEGDATHDKLRYGTHIFYINTIKSIALLLVAWLLGVIRQVLVFALAYGALRTFARGVHLKNTYLCTLAGFVCYLGCAYLSLYADISVWIKVAVLMICAAAFWLYAPAETRKRPIPQKRKQPLKIKSMCVLAVVSTVSLVLAFLPDYRVQSNLFFLAAVCQSVNILPITYKICKEN